jgi:hypothetical protein
LGPTLLRYFGLEPTPTMLGRDLSPVVDHDRPVREAGLFGIFGGHVNVVTCSDQANERYVYMRAPTNAENQPLNAYTLQTTRLRSASTTPTLTLSRPFSFSKALPLFQLPIPPGHGQAAEQGTLLFDLNRDPHQQQPLADPALEQRMVDHLIRLMQACDAPVEQYERLGLEVETPSLG